MSLEFWADLIKKAAQAAFSAEQEILGTREGRKKYSRGAGGDITREVDKVAEDLIISTFETAHEPFILISEEVGVYYWDPETSSRVTDIQLHLNTCKNYFIIDPVDGSRNAWRGIPFSCISIAYSTSASIQDISLGLVKNLSTGDEYFAQKGLGAFLNDSPIQCAPTTEIGKAILGIALKSHMPYEQFQPFVKKLLADAFKIRIFGSCALELCLVAQGALDLYVDLRNQTRIVDIAAGLLIVKEAGGFILNDTGDNLLIDEIWKTERYNLIAGAQGLHEAINRRLEK